MVARRGKKFMNMNAEEIQISLHGSEPKIVGKELSKMQIIQSLNWYQAHRERKHALQYFKDYIKKSKMPAKSKEAVEAVSGDITSTVGFVARMLTNGVVLPKNNKQWFDGIVSDLVKLGKIELKKTVIAPKQTISIQDRIAETTANCIGEIEGMIDDARTTGFKEMESPILSMQNHGIKGVHARKIVTHFKGMRDEIMLAQTGKDAELKEGYSNFKKVELKRFGEKLQTIIDKATDFISKGNANRKPRRRKVKTPEQLVAKMVVAPSDPKLKIVSIDPTMIIGASQVWVYNRKYRKIGVYNADDASGLTVKGSCIKNFSESTSITKMLRKPEQIVPEVLNGGKVFLRGVLGTIKTKEKGLTGRVNRDTILLRAIK